jgi:hypothetical protein
MGVTYSYEVLHLSVCLVCSYFCFQNDFNVAVLKALESETTYRKGKGQKTQPLMQIIMVRMLDIQNF